MSYLFLFLSFLFIAQPSQPETDGLSVSATAEVQLPADQIQFNINLNAEADSPQATYDLHKERERALVELLDRYEINEEDINYEPISISKNEPYNRDSENEVTYQTRQMVRLVLTDFEAYEKIQIGLIEAGYDNFSGQFMATKSEEGKEEALRKAIQKAKQKAQTIAEESGFTLGSISAVSYNYQQVQPYAQETMQLKAADSGSLMKYDQTVTVSATISMEFAILHQ